MGVSPSIMLKNADRESLYCAASRGLPEAYASVITDITLGPNVGTCGTAAYVGERQITEDIIDDPCWRDYQDIALLSGMRACWSEPIRGTHGDVLGTFALYYETPRTPTDQELAFFSSATDLVREALERAQHDRELEMERSARARSERRLQQLHDRAPDAIVTTDSSRRVVSFNNAAERMFGWTREAIVGEFIGVLIPPEHQEFHSDAAERFVSGAGGSHVKPRMVEARHRDGTLFSGEASLYYYIEGDERFATAIIRDVTEQRRLERAHERESALRKVIVDHVPSMIYWKDTAQMIQGCNLPFALAVGAETTEEVFGLETVHPPGWIVTEEVDPIDEKRILDGEINTFSKEVVIRHESGDERTIVIRNMCMKGPEDEIIGILGICDDVTDARRAVDVALQQQKMEALGRLVGGVAHDFNNLLFVIQSNLELIQDELPPGEFVSACLRDAIDATTRGARLTRQLLSSGRRANLSPRVIDLNDTLVRVESMLKRTIPATIDIELELDHFPCLIQIDVALLENALLNLAINARDAMKRGGVLTIGVDEVILEHEPDLALDTGRYARVRVQDTGEGMTPEVIQRAFEPFFTTKPVDEGTGMGLSMVHGFVVQSQGATRITSEPGEGTTVTLFFPSHEGSLSAISEVDYQPSLEDALRIMLVEDDASVRRALESVLESMGHEVTALENAADALELLEHMDEPPHVILSDAVMPGTVQGPELSERVRALYPNLQVVLMSGYPVLPASHARLPDLPIQLSKPFSRSELIAALDDAVYQMDTLND